jgi:hypothetical protein
VGSIGAPELIVLLLFTLVPVGVIVVAVRLIGGWTKRDDKLTACPDCKRRVSKRAMTCPSCGAPMG